MSRCISNAIIIEGTNNTRPIIKGSILDQQKLIKSEYRNLGSVALIHTKKKVIEQVLMARTIEEKLI